MTEYLPTQWVTFETAKPTRSTKRLSGGTHNEQVEASEVDKVAEGFDVRANSGSKKREVERDQVRASQIKVS